MAAKRPLVLDSFGGKQLIQAGDFVDVSAGGTGAVTAAQARINLGLQIGTDVLGYTAQLAALSALTGTGSVVRTGANTFAVRTLTAPAAGITVTNGDGVAGNPTLVLANDLAAVEGLAGTGMAARIGADTWAARTLTSAAAARVVITNGDGAAGNPTIDLATVANAGGGALLKFSFDGYGRVTGTSAVATGDLTALLDTTYVKQTGGSLTGYLTLHADPTQAMHPVTKQYADAIAEGRRDKPGVRFLVSSNISVNNPGTATFDGGTAVVNDRLLLAGQTAQAENGPWVFNGSGQPLSRPTDFNHDTQVVSGATYFVDQGTAYSDSNWTLVSTGPYVLGTTALVFTQTNSLGQITAGNGTTKTGNTISLNITARLAFNAGQLDLASGVVAPGTGTKLTVDTYGRVTGVATATPADVGAQPANADLSGVAAVNANGIYARTAAGTFAARTLTAPAAGLTISFGDGVGGNPTFALTNDLAALEGLAGTGFAVRTGADAWAQRTIAVASAARLVITNADGVGGNPTLDLAGGIVAPGTYGQVTVDQYGRVTAGAAGSASQPTISALTNGEATTTAIGSVMYTDASGSVKKANGNSASTSLPAGLLQANTPTATVGAVVTSGELTATTAEWDAITGQTGGLTVGVPYFLDNVTAGHMTTSVPGSGYLVPLGQAVSATKFVVRIGERVQL